MKKLQDNEPQKDDALTLKAKQIHHRQLEGVHSSTTINSQANLINQQIIELLNGRHGMFFIRNKNPELNYHFSKFTSLLVKHLMVLTRHIRFLDDYKTSNLKDSNFYSSLLLVIDDLLCIGKNTLEKEFSDLGLMQNPAYISLLGKLNFSEVIPQISEVIMYQLGLEEQVGLSPSRGVLVLKNIYETREYLHQNYFSLLRDIDAMKTSTPNSSPSHLEGFLQDQLIFALTKIMSLLAGAEEVYTTPEVFKQESDTPEEFQQRIISMQYQAKELLEILTGPFKDALETYSLALIDATTSPAK